MPAPDVHFGETSPNGLGRAVDQGVLNAFLRELLDDREAGRAKPCDEYQARWPDHAALIATEYARIAGGRMPEESSLDPDAPGPDAGAVAFGRYELRRLLACGGQGTVYLARDETGGAVAIKILSGLMNRSAEQVARFRREATVIERLDHPGICKIREYGEHEGIPFIAMEYVEGVALSERMAAWRASRAAVRSDAERAAQVDEMLGIFHGVASALHCAHEAGIVHRDVKPQNIMIRPSGAPVVLDFGIASVVDATKADLTRTGEVLGTPSYMSPEQIDAGVGRVDARSDVFSLGATLYEAATGERPFQAPTCEGILREITHGEPRNPRSLDPAFSRDLELVLAMALEKSPARRYASALEFACDLDRLRRGADVAAKAPAPWTRVRKWAHRNPRKAWWAGALFAILASLTGIALYMQAQAVAALADYRRLAGAATLLELKNAVDELWPPVPELIPRYRAWLERADALAAALPQHEAELRQLEARGRFVAVEDEKRTIGARAIADAESHRRHLLGFHQRLEAERPSSESRAEFREASLRDIQATLPRLERTLVPKRRWRFENPEDQSRYDIIAALVDDLHVFLDADRHRGLRADIRDRFEFASTVERKSLREHADAWSEVIAAIGDRRRCPQYQGLVIKPQLGLIPLGRDPDSGLYEFMDLYTADRSGAGSVEVGRDREGHVRPSVGQGVIFVLIPGGWAFRGDETRSEDLPYGPDVATARVMSGIFRPHHLDPYLIGKYEMTRAQWARLSGMRPSQFPGSDVGPVDCVTWIEADLWLRRAGMVLPTGFQWERAARGGEMTPWHTGSDRRSLIGYANIAGQEFAAYGEPVVKCEEWNDGHQPPTDVGALRPNGFGLHDVHGNVCEWVREPVPTSVAEPRPGDGDSVQVTSEERLFTKVQRGGSYRRDAIVSKISYELEKTAHVRDYESGVRAARNLDP